MLDLRSGFRAGEPMGLVSGAGRGRWREVAVGREGCFESDEGGAVPDKVGEGFVDVSCLLLQSALGDFDVCGAELRDPLSADEWVWVFGGDDYAGYTGGDEGVGARAGAPGVGAGFESDVGGSSSGGFASLFEGYNLGVVSAIVEVGPLGDDLVIADEDAAYLGIGAGQGGGLLSEGKGSLHEDFVLRIGRHVLKRIACRDEVPAGYPPPRRA